jgi:hypothetical protein
MRDGVAHSRDADLSTLVNLNTKIICKSNNKNEVSGIKVFKSRSHQISTFISVKLGFLLNLPLEEQTERLPPVYCAWFLGL